MNATTIAIIIVVVGLIALALFILWRQRRSKALRERFGPEYRHAVGKLGDERKAEAELAARQERVQKFKIRSLASEERNRFGEAWRQTQARFVDEPSGAVQEADRLVQEAMQARGYPVSEFEQRAADLSVDHPDVVTNYRAAYDIATRNKSGAATTEDLRQAMVHYRSLFDDLLETSPNAATNQEAIRR